VGERTDTARWDAKNGVVHPVHRLDFFSIHPFSKDFAMTFNDPKTTATPAAPVKAEQHHAKAAEHLEYAAKSHKEVSKLLSANDATAAKAHVKVAQEHMDKAHEHAEAAKKATVAA
jgi:hypothetical protein